MYCTKCGNTLPDDSLICGYCGAVVSEEEQREFPSQPQQEGEALEAMAEEQADSAVPVLSQEELEALPSYSARVEEMVDLCSAAAEQLKGDEPGAAADEDNGNEEPDPTEQAAVPRHAVDEPETTVAVAAGRRGPGADKRARPMRTAGFFGTQLLLLIPVINIILLFVWAFRRRSNFNRKAYARSILIWILIVLLLLLTGLLAMIIFRIPTDINYWIDQLKAAVNSIPYVS